MQTNRTETYFRPEAEVLVIVHVHAKEVRRGLAEAETGYPQEHDQQPHRAMNELQIGPSAGLSDHLLTAL